MIRERALRIMLVVSVFMSVTTAISFIYFIDQFPTMQAFSVTMKHIDFLDGSYIINKSLTWMYVLIGFNVLTFGLAVFFFKPKDKKFVELALYNVLLSVLYVVGLYWFISMFPDVIPSAVDHGFVTSNFKVDGDPFQAVNIIYVITFAYFLLNTIFFSLQTEN